MEVEVGGGVGGSRSTMHLVRLLDPHTHAIARPSACLPLILLPPSNATARSLICAANATPSNNNNTAMPLAALQPCPSRCGALQQCAASIGGPTWKVRLEAMADPKPIQLKDACRAAAAAAGQWQQSGFGGEGGGEGGKREEQCDHVCVVTRV